MHQQVADARRSELQQRVQLGLMLTPHSAIALTSPPWIKNVVDRIDYLLLVPMESLGDEGKPLDFETVMQVLTFLLSKASHSTPAPQIIPTSVGGLQLEWHTSGRDLEITFDPHSSPAFFYAAPGGLETEGDAIERNDLVEEAIRGLSVQDERTLIAR